VEECWFGLNKVRGKPLFGESEACIPYFGQHEVIRGQLLSLLLRFLGGREWESRRVRAAL